MKEILVLLLVFFIYLSRGRKKAKPHKLHKRANHSFFFFFFLSVSGSSCSVWRPESKRWDHTHGEEYVLTIIPWSDSFSVVYIGPLQAMLLTRDNFVFSPLTCGDHTLLMGLRHLNALNRFSLPAFLSTELRATVQHIEALLAWL